MDIEDNKLSRHKKLNKNIVILENIRKLNNNKDSFIHKPINIRELNIGKNPIFFVGLSHKLNRNGEILEAFSADTTSGKLLHEIKEESQKNIIMLNLVQGVPLDKNGK